MTTTLMTVSEVANDLNVSPIEGQRLIARQRLTATRLGDCGPYRVTVGNLETYVNAGAPDLALQEYDRASGSSWFTGSLSYLARAFEQAIRDAAPTYSDESLRPLFTDKATDSVNVAIQPTGKVLKVINREVPQFIFGSSTATGAADTRFRTWGDLWGVDILRTAMQQTLQNTLGIKADGLNTVYDSPQAYQSLTAAAYATAAIRTIEYRKNLNVEGVTKTVNFIFTGSSIFTPAAQARLVGLAF